MTATAAGVASGADDTATERSWGGGLGFGVLDVMSFLRHNQAGENLGRQRRKGVVTATGSYVIQSSLCWESLSAWPLLGSLAAFFVPSPFPPA